MKKRNDPEKIPRVCFVLFALAAVSAVLCPDEAGQIRYCIGSETVDLKSRVKELNEALDGRGGGSPQMIQGTFRTDAKTAARVLASCFG